MSRLKNKTNICIQCNSTFHPWHCTPNAQFCSSKCHYQRGRVVRRCQTCGVEFESLASQDRVYGVKFCSRKCKGVPSRLRLLGDAAPWYKGGWINPNGYRVISVDSQKYFEHRYVVEQSLGRPLRKDETVHHIDGDKLNNDISNLRVMSYRDHTLLHWKLKKESK